MTRHADLLQEPDQNVQLPAAAQHYDDSSVISYMCQQAPDVRYLESKQTHRCLTDVSEAATHAHAYCG